MLIAVETSTLYAGIAIMDDRNTIARAVFSPEKPASEYLLGTLSEMMSEKNITFDDISIYAVSIGPGSFTGLRVGVTAVKTLAYSHQRPVIPVPTLDAMAYQAGRCSQPVAVVMDARKGEIYGARYHWKDVPERMSNPTVSTIESFFRDGDKDTDYVLIGDALYVYREKILDRIGKGSICTDESRWRPDPVTIGRLAVSGRYPALEGQALFSLIPTYIRRPEAEIQWERKFGST